MHGVAVKPGHPVVLGTVDGTAVLGAPGYPVSAALTFDIFAIPLLAALEGAAPVDRPRAQARLARRLASSLGSDDWIRVRLGRVGGGLVAAPLRRGAGVLTSLVRADGLLVVPAALEGHDAGAQVEVRLLRDLDAVERTIVAIGSHDPVLDLAASLLRARDPLLTLVSGPVGSLGGLVALRDGLCHLSGCHLLDPARGEYTLPWIDRVLPGQRGRGRPPRPPRAGADRRRRATRSASPASPIFRALRYVNRQRGAGTRVLLDHELGRAEIDRSPSTATSARSRRTSPSPPRSPPAARTPAWASWRPRARSGWTSSPSRASRSTW